MPAFKTINLEDETIQTASQQWEEFFNQKIINRGIDPFLIDHNIDPAACIMSGRGPEYYKIESKNKIIPEGD
jgi:hypothetical protein